MLIYLILIFNIAKFFINLFSVLYLIFKVLDSHTKYLIDQWIIYLTE
jgi:hypothetical protein